MLAPDPGTFAGELFERAAPLGGADPADLIVWCKAVGAMFQDMRDITRDSADGTPGYGKLMSADTAPAPYLGWIAQFQGVALDASLDVASQRLRIKTTDGFRRGSPGALIGAAQSDLVGDRTVILRERYNPTVPGSDAYHFEVITYESQTPNPAKLAASVESQKPGGLILHLALVPGEDWQSVKNTNVDWQHVKTTYATWLGVKQSRPGV